MYYNMFSNYLFQKILIGVSAIVEIFVYKNRHLLPHYISEIDCHNTTIGKRCLDGNMDSVFFV
jgi:hypothetical protein